jgi:hypothetical protein
MEVSPFFTAILPAVLGAHEAQTRLACSLLGPQHLTQLQLLARVALHTLFAEFN